jgi:5-methylcytosine-specific restriction endonuclease McrA
MSTRGYGRGTIAYRVKDGQWIGRIDVAPEPNRKRKVFSGKDRAAVERKMDEWLAEHRPHRAEARLPGSREQHIARARAIARHTKEEWRAKVAAADGACHWCKRPVSIGGVKDHVTPVSRGGSDGIENVVLACWDCNAAKSDLTGPEFIEWAERTGFFGQPQRITISTTKGNRRIPRDLAALMRIPRGERGELFNSGKLAARVRLEMERMS